MQEFDKCPLTGWKLVAENLNPYAIKNYFWIKIQNGRKNFSYLIEKNLLSKISESNKHQHIFRWVLLNNLSDIDIQFIRFSELENNPEQFGLAEEAFNKYLVTFSNVSPKEKLDHLLLTLYKLSDDSYSLKQEIEKFCLNTGFRNGNEIIVYLKALEKKKLLSFPGNAIYLDKVSVQLTVEGLLKISSLEESGKNSKRCFIAMSFDPIMLETREAIRNGIKDSGYDPIIIDEVHPNPDQTINDAIIAEIKRSKFIVADFTNQNRGVYFEAGYAIGRGIKVIYCCNEEDFKNSHFDTKAFAHLLYNSPEDLRQKLKNKIEAWIE